MIHAIHYGITQSPFGTCLIASSHAGVCLLRFIETLPSKRQLQSLFPNPELKRNDPAAAEIAASIFNLRSKNPKTDLHGTPFQVAVWNALAEIPFGSTTSYSDVAKNAGYPNAHRAVGTAIGNNPIAFLIPCHRVIRANGNLGNYRWGTPLKQKILDWEQGACANNS